MPARKVSVLSCAVPVIAMVFVAAVVSPVGRADEGLADSIIKSYLPTAGTLNLVTLANADLSKLDQSTRGHLAKPISWALNRKMRFAISFSSQDTLEDLEDHGFVPISVEGSRAVLSGSLRDLIKVSGHGDVSMLDMVTAPAFQFPLPGSPKNVGSAEDDHAPRAQTRSFFFAGDPADLELIKNAELAKFSNVLLSILDETLKPALNTKFNVVLKLGKDLTKRDLTDRGIPAHTVSGRTASARLTLGQVLRASLQPDVIQVTTRTSIFSW